jgi:hypothetical protein
LQIMQSHYLPSRLQFSKQLRPCIDNIALTVIIVIIIALLGACLDID